MPRCLPDEVGIEVEQIFDRRRHPQTEGYTVSMACDNCGWAGKLIIRWGTSVPKRGEADSVCPHCGVKALESTQLDSPSTHPVQRDMLEFFEAVGGLVGGTPGLRNERLNADLILEEAGETAESITGRRVVISFDNDQPALRPRSLAGTIDGLCDQLATIYGAAVTFGIDLAPFWEEVHRTNLTKAGGPRRDDGKCLKPEGWEPPDIEGVLARLHPEPPPSEVAA